MPVIRLYSLRAYEECIHFVTLESVKITYVNNMSFYIIDNVYIILLDVKKFIIIRIKKINGIVNLVKEFANSNP